MAGRPNELLSAGAVVQAAASLNGRHRNCCNFQARLIPKLLKPIPKLLKPKSKTNANVFRQKKLVPSQINSQKALAKCKMPEHSQLFSIP
jgi:hypothetical protein